MQLRRTKVPSTSVQIDTVQYSLFDIVANPESASSLRDFIFHPRKYSQPVHIRFVQLDILFVGSFCLIFLWWLLSWSPFVNNTWFVILKYLQIIIQTPMLTEILLQHVSTADIHIYVSLFNQSVPGENRHHSFVSILAVIGITELTCWISVIWECVAETN